MKDICVIYGGKIDEGLLLVTLAFNEEDLDGVLDLCYMEYSKVLKPTDKQVFIRMKELRGRNLNIITNYRLFSKGEYHLREVRFCIEEYIKQVQDRRLGRLLFFTLNRGVLGETHLPNVISLTSEKLRSSKYLNLSYFLWTYYRRILDGKQID